MRSYRRTMSTRLVHHDGDLDGLPSIRTMSPSCRLIVAKPFSSIGVLRRGTRRTVARPSSFVSLST